MMLKLLLVGFLSILQAAYAVYAPRRFIKLDTLDARSMDLTKGACFRSKSYNYKLQPILATLKRGARINLSGFKNDRVGGFIRFSIVPVHDMFKKEAHNKFAFHYSCADSRPSRCISSEREMCKNDRRHELYRYSVKVPRIYRDGIYVLGIARYGSFPHESLKTRFLRGLGDYYSCSRIRIKDGPLRKLYKPRFETGPTITGTHTSCRARYNNICCVKKYCSSLHPILTRPMEFMNHKKLPMISSRSTARS